MSLRVRVRSLASQSLLASSETINPTRILAAVGLLSFFLTGCGPSSSSAPAGALTQQQVLDIEANKAQELAQRAQASANQAQLAAQRAQLALDAHAASRGLTVSGGSAVRIIKPPPIVTPQTSHDLAVTPLPAVSVEWLRHQGDIKQQDRERMRE
jgi:hypothetical protein